jgi:endo-1,4-beta-xylanase
MKKILSALLTLALVCSLFAGMPIVKAAPSNATLLNTYASLFGHTGTCVYPAQWDNGSIRNFIKGEYNSITMENEMKPDAVLRSNTMSVSQAKAQGYNIPSNYTDSKVPTLNFSTIDKMMKAAAENGLQIRYHVLVWHAQTPDWFFRANYSSGSGYVGKSQMNARLEFYIRSVMDHVMNSQYANTVYAWDVVNEYMHAQNCGWLSIYGGVNTRPDFVKLAFQIAHSELVKFNKQNSVSLFYNDFNTYMDCDKIISMINFINAEGKICNGIGMQSHLSSSFPSPSYYKQALDKFVKQGYEIQITELDAGGKNDSDQATYYKQIMSAILSAKKAGGNITGITWWGLHDGASWRGNDKPLLFSSLGVKKPAYTAVLDAYFDAGYQIGSKPSNPSTPVVSKAPVVSEKLDDGTYYIKNVLSGKYLQVKDNKGADVQNVEIGTGTGVQGQKWVLKNNSDGTVTLTSALGNYSLDIANGVDEDGANVQIYSSWGGDAQKFYVVKTATNGVYEISTKASAGTKVLDVYERRTDDGTNIIQWTSNGGTNQQFVFEKVNSTTTPSVAPSTAPSVAPSAAPSSAPVTSTGVTYDYKVVSDWGNGFQGQVVVTNKSGKAINNWTLTFNANFKVASLWGADFAGQSGSKVTVKAPSWDGNLANGASVTINFVAEGSDKSAPSSYTIG